jgi:hypothetical protein
MQYVKNKLSKNKLGKNKINRINRIARINNG